MIITCPSCQTRYLVDEAALGGALGRRLRCAGCGHLWHYSAAAADGPAAREAGTGLAAVTPPPAVPAEQALRPPSQPSFAVAEFLRADLRGEPEPAAPPIDFPSLTAADEPPPAARRREQRTRVSPVVVVVALALAVILGGDVISELYPPAAPIYRRLHLIDPIGADLEITVQPPLRTPNTFVVAGNVFNNGTTARQVPPLQAILRDGNGGYLASQIVTPTVERLSPGATAHFSVVFEHPSITAAAAEVSFAGR